MSLLPEILIQSYFISTAKSIFHNPIINFSSNSKIGSLSLLLLGFLINYYYIFIIPVIFINPTLFISEYSNQIQTMLLIFNSLITIDPIIIYVNIIETKFLNSINLSDFSWNLTLFYYSTNRKKSSHSLVSDSLAFH